MAGDIFIGGGQTVAAIHQKQDDIRLLDGQHRLGRHGGINALLLAGDTAGIHHHKALAIVVTLAIFAIAGKTGEVGHQGIPAAGKAVEQGGFAHVGAAHQGDNRKHGIGVGWSKGGILHEKDGSDVGSLKSDAKRGRCCGSALARLRHSHDVQPPGFCFCFRLPTSDFRLPTSDFRLPTVIYSPDSQSTPPPPKDLPGWMYPPGFPVHYRRSCAKCAA